MGLFNFWPFRSNAGGPPKCNCCAPKITGAVIEEELVDATIAKNLREQRLEGAKRTVIINGTPVEITGDDFVVKSAYFPFTLVRLDVKLDQPVEGNVIVHNGDVTIEGPVGGYVDAGGDVRCDSVGEYANAGGDITCGDVGGDVDAGGDIRCGDVGGYADAGGDINASNVDGDVNAGGDVTANDVMGTIDAGGDVTAHDLLGSGSISAGGDVNFGRR